MRLRSVYNNKYYFFNMFNMFIYSLYIVYLFKVKIAYNKSHIIDYCNHYIIRASNYP